jgi:acetyltransferase
MTYTIDRYPAELIDVVSVKSGERVTIRPVLPQDEELVATFFRNLSDAARRNRFFRSLRELPPALLHAFTSIDYHAHLALIATIHVGPCEAIVGEARYVVVAPGEAEFAVTVADAWQGQGVGTMLLSRLISRAEEEGVTRLFGDVLLTNQAMRRLAGNLGMVVAPTGEGLGLLRAEMSVGTPKKSRSAVPVPRSLPPRQRASAQMEESMTSACTHQTFSVPASYSAPVPSARSLLERVGAGAAALITRVWADDLSADRAYARLLEGSAGKLTDSLEREAELSFRRGAGFSD